MLTEDLLLVIISLVTSVIEIGYVFVYLPYDNKRNTVVSGNVGIAITTIICLLILWKIFLAIQIDEPWILFIIEFLLYFIATILSMILAYKRAKAKRIQEKINKLQEDVETILSILPDKQKQNNDNNNNDEDQNNNK